MQKWTLGMTALAIFSAALVLFFFNPSQHAFYPQCPFYRATGLLCPGCGGLRAMHQLFHGHFAAAFRFNPLAVLLLPVAGWAVLRLFVNYLTGKKLPPLFLRQEWCWVLVAALLLFGVLRNLPAFRSQFPSFL